MGRPTVRRDRRTKPVAKANRRARKTRRKPTETRSFVSAAAGNGAHGSTTTPTNTDADAGLYRTFAAIADLKPHPQNYRTHTDEQLEHLAASIREHGVYRNVVVSWDGVILAGHGVVLAAAKLGRKMVPIVRVPFDSGDPRAVKLLIGDNQIGQLAGVDDRQLIDLLQTINESDLVSLVGTGYDAEHLSALLDDVPPAPASSQDDDTATRPAPLQVIVYCASEADRTAFYRKLHATAKHIAARQNRQAIWFPLRDQAPADTDDADGFA